MKLAKFTLIPTILLAFQITFADVIPDNSHYVTVCAQITNISDYANLHMVGYVLMGSDHESTYEITSGDCLTKGYHMNTLEIYAVNDVNYTDTNINIQTLDFHKARFALKSNIKINPYIGYVDDSDPTAEVQEFYQIMGFTATNVVLFLSKRITKYNNGEADKIEDFTYDGDVSALNQQIPVGIPDPENNSGFSVFPNPSVGYVNIKSGTLAESLNINVYTVTGKLIMSEVLQKDKTQETYKLNTSKLVKGIYLLQVNSGDLSETRKIIVK